ncbi:MAG: winged helix-turn-helix transcriptional regulator [Actinobacteria bacterium]|nr:winged helix-turn-helix transcriptional regulator [Actinomycetota bacterium]MBO0836730.1 winged helix-turn-helix transcriptional regulator [Actinomycetota bacterium]
METYGSAGIAALGDPTRRAIFESLALGPKSVGELAAELPVSRPAVSQHLRVLKEAGLVSDRPAGTRRIYQIQSLGVQAIHGYLDQMWSQAMAAFQAEAERAAGARGGSASPPAAESAAAGQGSSGKVGSNEQRSSN